MNDNIERPPFHVLHHEVQDVMAFFDRENGNDVGVAERRGGPRFPLEPLHHALAHLKQDRREDFDGDFAIEGEIVGQVHRGHTTMSEDAEDFVFADRRVAEGVVEGGRDRRHRVSRKNRDASSAARAKRGPRAERRATAGTKRLFHGPTIYLFAAKTSRACVIAWSTAARSAGVFQPVLASVAASTRSIQRRKNATSSGDRRGCSPTRTYTGPVEANGYKSSTGISARSL